MVYVGQTESEAHAGADKLLWYMRANKVPFHLCYPPGYLPAAAQVQIMRGAALDQHAALKDKMVVEKAVEVGIMFAGTPDQVFNQIKRHYEHVGGYGHLLIMGQAGFLEHDETVAGIRNFAREVYPRLKEAFPDTRVSSLETMAAAG
jgi:alkanesulfonate monooxygenase SsuD/methylene tetrahydromethanopterin reductase-like flavin-dependent oxidoreductase (luciferase family)